MCGDPGSKQFAFFRLWVMVQVVYESDSKKNATDFRNRSIYYVRLILIVYNFKYKKHTIFGLLLL